MPTPAPPAASTVSSSTPSSTASSTDFKKRYLDFIGPIDQKECMTALQNNATTPFRKWSLNMNKSLGTNARRCIKLLDIGYVTVLYFVIGFALAVLTDRILGKFDATEAEKKSTSRVVLELLLHMWVYGLLVYFVRNIVQHTPSPFHNVWCFDHTKVKEMQSATSLQIVAQPKARPVVRNRNHRRGVGSCFSSGSCS